MEEDKKTSNDHSDNTGDLIAGYFERVTHE